jgi:hypothetical protein
MRRVVTVAGMLNVVLPVPLLVNRGVVALPTMTVTSFDGAPGWEPFAARTRT